MGIGVGISVGLGVGVGVGLAVGVGVGDGVGEGVAVGAGVSAGTAVAGDPIVISSPSSPHAATTTNTISNAVSDTTRTGIFRKLRGIHFS
jgi:hypothetical protein